MIASSRCLAILVLCSFSIALQASAQSVIYVDQEASGNEDGSSWSDAYTDLQAAIDEAAAGQGAFEIWVATGTYRPSKLTDGSDSRSATFQLADDVALFGGFEGTETERTERNPDPASNGTVLSGDIGSEGFRGDDAYHVVTGSGTNSTAVLDGFTVRLGRADGDDSADKDGGGMYNADGNPTLRNCLFEDNTAADDGAGMFNDGSSPEITNCRFDGNAAGFGGGGIANLFESSPVLRNVVFTNNSADLVGGGLDNSFDSNPQITNSRFEGNVSDFEGGGMRNNFNSAPTLMNVRFAGNRADSYGGGIANDDSDPVLVNVVLSGNKADSGGGIYNYSSSPLLTNVTVSGNDAANGFGGGDGGGVYNTDDSFPQIRNSILWGNAAAGTGNQIFLDSSSQPLVGHSIIEGGLPEGTFDDGSNQDADPFFETPVDPDNAPTVEGNLRILTDGSPALDAANEDELPTDSFDLDGDGNTSEPVPVDIDNTPRLIDNRNNGAPDLDLGAFEAPSQVLPVELTSFQARLADEAVVLSWTTASETNNAGFHIERKGETEAWTEIGFVEGFGTVSRPQSYSFTDANLPFGAGVVTYRLRQVDFDGSTEYSETINAEVSAPGQPELLMPYPNPASNEVTVRYALPRAGKVALAIYNAIGQRVTTLASSSVEPGQHVLPVDVSSLTSGVYFVRLRAADTILTRKLTVVR